MIGFWPRIKCALVFFTDPVLVPIFQDMLKGREGPTHIIGVPFHELTAFKKLSAEVWSYTRAIDPEQLRHSAELYAIWYEKKEFIARAIEANPFGSDHFVWCDAGICRRPEWVDYLQGFPKREFIPPAGRMLILRIAPFEAQDAQPDKNGIMGNFGERVSVGGGILASDIAGWKSWSKAYDAMLMRYYLADRFIGKDQNIMASMILERPDSVYLVDRSPANSSMQR